MDKTMSKWPKNLNNPVDLIQPYPCQTCRKPFRSCYGLRTHDCQPRMTQVGAASDTTEES